MQYIFRTILSSWLIAIIIIANCLAASDGERVTILGTIKNAYLIDIYNDRGQWTGITMGVVIEEDSNKFQMNPNDSVS